MTSQLSLEGIVLGQEALKTGLVDSMNDLTRLLIVPDALRQGETRSDDVEQADDQERTYPAAGRKVGDTGDHRDPRHGERYGCLDEERGRLFGLDFKVGHSLIMWAGRFRYYPGLPSLPSGARPTKESPSAHATKDADDRRAQVTGPRPNRQEGLSPL